MSGAPKAPAGARWIVAGIVWVLILAVLGVVFRFAVSPRLRERSQREAQTQRYAALEEEARRRGVVAQPLPAGADASTIRGAADDLERRLTRAGGGTDPGGSPGRGVEVALALDSFSGYAILRSEEFRRLAEAQGARVTMEDDAGDYDKRLAGVADGRTPMAVFTVDALVGACARAGRMPATIVLVLDESVGADALVAYKQGIANIDALNDERVRIVATPASPSETLGRVVMSGFDLPRLSREPFIAAPGAGEVYKRFIKTPVAEPRAFAMWEPYVSRALANPNAQVLIDSSRFRGYIVDVLVAQREFALKNERAVRGVVEAYLRALHESRRGGEAPLAELVRRDAAAGGEALSPQQAARLVQTIWWKNTTENYAHFALLSGGSGAPAGLASGGGGGGVQPLDQIIRRVTQVLLTTGGIERDPSRGDASAWYYDRILRAMRDENFHPGPAASGPEAARADAELPGLTDAQWTALVPVGTLSVERIVFARGTATITDQSRQALTKLGETLNAFHRYYVVVRGNARPEGDPDANRRLAEARARAAAGFLTEAGVAPARIRVTSGVSEASSGGEGQTVTFVLGQVAY